MAGFSFWIDNVLGVGLVPQPFVVVTDTVPLTKPDGYVNEIVFVPCPVKPIAPAGTVQL